MLLIRIYLTVFLQTDNRPGWVERNFKAIQMYFFDVQLRIAVQFRVFDAIVGDGLFGSDFLSIANSLYKVFLSPYPNPLPNEAENGIGLFSLDHA